MIAHPFCKWLGGKSALLHEILPRLPEKIKTYHEPFIGGGAVFFMLAEQKRFEHASLADINDELINAYACVARDPSKVIGLLKQHVYEEQYYYGIRAQTPQRMGVNERAARFIYLNRTCFNGLYRVNKKGQFNVPFGKYTNPTICDEENLRAVGKVIRATTLATAKFERVLSEAEPGDAAYFDPPYLPVSDTSNFTAYSKGGFTADDHVRLRDVARTLVDRGVHVLLSNSDTPFTRELYKGFKVEEVQAPRRVNSKGGKRGKVGELLISGKNS